MESYLRITELFYSLQGEGLLTGLPCFFIRTAGCDLRCSWCDTPEAMSGGKRMSLDEILASVPESAPSIQITGGEPMLQRGPVLELMEQLHARYPAKKILLETGGHRSIHGVPSWVHICMDVKLPSSGEAERDFASNLPALKATDEVKFVVASREDFQAAMDWVRQHRLTELCSVLISPAWGLVELPLLSAWILEEGLPVRLQLQLHKVVWGANAKGV